ncbi:LPXTG cell wall anchor domain-containing protein [Enterococcus casseliflavus]|uniref:LPXTG cell wall anchor domain-containing protein n=1 Tax=Enterococcus casseliflavus TaxID=37734 RepID=UPI001432E368|nr:LPXTG cell wall anchor domain-containing protein [Enterococcus casseliflavus]NKD31638.1 LPXTG cell wall anchor domain-containing protein [Enterococcus casseliflavus]
MKEKIRMKTVLLLFFLGILLPITVSGSTVGGYSAPPRSMNAQIQVTGRIGYSAELSDEAVADGADAGVDTIAVDLSRLPQTGSRLSSSMRLLGIGFLALFFLKSMKNQSNQKSV